MVAPDKRFEEHKGGPVGQGSEVRLRDLDLLVLELSVSAGLVWW